MIRPWILLTLFFASGVSALMYEVVWIRLLTLTLSITVYSLTTVLCAFMAGLGLGAAISARISDRVKRPLVGFGLLELGIALCGVTVPLILFGLGPAYIWIFDASGGSGTLFNIGRFLLAFLVVLVPCTLMGVTLPLLSRSAVENSDVVGRGTGMLYAVNTLGAVVGCCVAGFVMIPAAGLFITSVCAAVLNVAVCVAALTFGFRTAPVHSEPGQVQSKPAQARAPRPPRPPLPAGARLAAFAFGVSGLTAMGYELLWTRALEHYTHNSTYAYTAMLAMFLLGIGGGSAVCAKIADRIKRPLYAVGAIQVGVGVSVTVALLIYMQFDWLVPAIGEKIGGLASWNRVVVLLFTEAGITMALTTILLGATFPLVARVAVDSLDSVANRVGFVYVANTIGSILGCLVVGFAVLPLLGVRGSFLALILLNLGVGLLVVLRAEPARSRAVVTVGAVLTAILAFTMIPSRLFEDQYEARYNSLLFYREEVTDTVMVTEDESGSRMIRYSDGRGTAGTKTALEDRYYAHLAMMLHSNPKQVLQICFGVGNSLSATLQHPVDHVDCVELSPGVVDAAPFFSDTNRDALEDPRVNLVIRDGRNFLLTSHDRYDVIRLDPPELHTAGVVNLYTREFYELARDHLAEGGLFSIWINIALTPMEDTRAVARTIASVFPHVSIWRSPRFYSWVINGSETPMELDLARLSEHLGNETLRSDITLVPTDPLTVYDFLSCFVMSGSELEAYVGEGALVVDNHTRLDFTVPRSREAYFGLTNSTTDYFLGDLITAEDDIPRQAQRRNIRKMYDLTTPVFPYLTGVGAEGFDRAEVERRLQEAAEKLPWIPEKLQKPVPREP